MVLVQHDLEIAERRVLRPEIAGESGVARRDREQEQVVYRQQGPYQDRDADEQKLRLARDLGYGTAHGLSCHLDRRLIMKYTSGRTSGSAETIAAIDRLT